ncbi:Fur family transcriptional regulator [Cohnella thailandensis]|uniref:Transcriptional repressor n=1 Tax=Cohnella thailandensis TaxID=557557 RepID=A0A841SSZ6_9BACL|nr:Fur family transcriptional regulator [Cohnella thailandensis]MBB6633338.1 transcriptional repressor [Cohnella thailandensis]MBP1977320.1 Fe2+ or Zn2+ uptake regulation protein [Cohnella thailandensis]
MNARKYVDRCLMELFNNGMRVTEQRKRMLSLVANSKHPQTAMELYRKMKRTFPGLSYETIYLNLKLFMDLRFIETILLGNEVRYRALPAVHAPLVQYICMDCKKAIQVSFDPSHPAFPMPEQFKSVNYKLDIFGYCRDCCDRGGSPAVQ